jgi:ABC-type uncharacterized transport system auxiliary subunit
MTFGRAAVFAIVAVLSEAACSIGRPISSITTYNVSPSISSHASASRNSERLKVERPRVLPPYDKAALVYRLSDVRYVADPYNAFIAEPGPMLGRRIAECLGAAGLFEGVDVPGSAAPAPFVLESTVTDLYGDFGTGDGHPAAVMSIRFVVIDGRASRPKVAYDRLLSQRVPATNTSAEALVAAYDTALGAILGQLVTELSEARLQ